MAYYAALVSVVQLLKEINHNQHPYPNPLPENHQIHVSLYTKLSHLQELLEDYKDHREESSDIILERRIRDAAYRAQDIIESNISDEINPADQDKRRGPPIDRRSRGSVKKRIFQHLIPPLKKDPQRLKGPMLDNIVEKPYYQDLKKVKAEVDSIVEELMRIKDSCNNTHQHWQLTSHVSSDSTGGGGASKVVQGPSEGSTMVGFDKYLTTIKDQLCGQLSKREVIAIVGMGGLGKTTLARNIFEDKLVDDRFDCRAWITVSQDYHLEKVLVEIIDYMNITDNSITIEELRDPGRALKENIYKDLEGILKNIIYQHLKGRRYLIIMDDVWDKKVWNDVNKIFPNDGNGSRIILTTRLLDVAVYAGFVHQLQFLNKDQSWNLFCQKVLCPLELEDIGRLIAESCRGLPLAIVVVAGLLSKVNKTRHDWKEIARDVCSAAIDQNDEHFTKILSLSYNHLPHHLKPCFLYLGGFPEYYEIRVSKLIKLWVAEGFLKPDESKSLEEVGEEYFKDLVNRNLVLITENKSNGKFKYCSIHELLRDLCSQRGRDENFLHCQHKKDDFHREPIENVRRFYIYSDDSIFCKYKEEYISHFRAIPFFANDLLWGHFLSVASCFKHLRVLDLGNVTMSSFPTDIVELFHLRYLALQAFDLHIPPSIFKLQNLQTLIIDGFPSLPSEIWKMPNLRHVISLQSTLPPVPYGEWIVDRVPLLESLQTLWGVKDFIFTSDTVEMIPSLKKLKIECTYEKNWEEFGLINLVHLHQLETLKMYFSKWRTVAAPLPENFSFPSNLIKLSLAGCELPWKYMTVVGSLLNLQVLKLRDDAFVGEEWEPTEGEFLKLKFLLMDSLVDLKYWRAEDTHFPRLEQLKIRYCWNLEGIPSGIGEIPTLQFIQVYSSKLSAGHSALRIQEEQHDHGNDDFEVRVFPQN